MEKDLTGSYPIIIGGDRRGEISVSREGLFWCFEASSDMCDEIIRLSVYGENAEGYLGILEPVGEKLRLKKKVSRSGLAGFPKLISHGGRQGETQTTAPVPDTPEPSLEPCQCQAVQIDDKCEISRENFPLENDLPPPANAPEAVHSRWLPCACPCSLFSKLSAKSLLGEMTTALISTGAGYLLLAIPLQEADALPKNDILYFSETEEIFGSVYRISKISDGICIK